MQLCFSFFFFQAEDGIRDLIVTGVQTCALPISLHVYQAIQESTPGAQNMLVMGPWFHGGWSRSDGDVLGNVRFGSKTSVFYRENIEFPFFSYWLKGKKNPSLPKAYVFETGANQWRQFDAWPPKSVTKKS